MRRASRPRRESRRAVLPLDEAPLHLSVWVRLLRAHGLVLRAVRRRLPRGLTLPQFDVLAQLHRHPDGLLPSELTEALLVTAGNVTGIVKRLEGQGVVERSRVPDDRRAVRVRLTPRGFALVAGQLPAHARALEEILGPVPAADLAVLRERLGALSRTLEGAHAP
jgi:DNA-binding MarR family transcriptional regulator